MLMPFGTEIWAPKETRNPKIGKIIGQLKLTVPKGEALATYDRVSDTIYFDPFIVAGCMFASRYQGNPEIVYEFQKTFRHERVHQSLGNSEPCRELREAGLKFARFAGDLVALYSALAKGHDQDSVIRTKKYSRVIKRLESMGIFSNEAAFDESKRLEKAFHDINEQIGLLGIDIVDCALADAFIDDREGFTAEFEKRSISPEDQVEIFDVLKAEIAKYGKLQTLKRVRNVMNQAWVEEKYALNYIG